LLYYSIIDISRKDFVVADYTFTLHHQSNPDLPVSTHSVIPDPELVKTHFPPFVFNNTLLIILFSSLFTPVVMVGQFG